MQFEGIYTPAITPFTATGEIDREGFQSIIDRTIESGVQGIIVGGTTGEYYALTKAERLETFALAKQAIGGRVPLVAGVNALRTEDAIELALAAKKVQADCILLGAPYYAMPTEQELIRHLLAVDQKADLPIMLYNFPDRTGVPMGEAFMDRAARCGNVVAIKESSGDINRVHLLARNYPHIQMSCGMDDQALEFFAWGARSWVCGASNFLPREHHALYKACVLDNDFIKGRRIMSAMLPLMGMLEQGGKFVQCIKYGCQSAGLPAGPVRKPLRPLDKTLKREMTVIVETLQRTIQQIEAE